ncbi:deoxyguanosinetriphosphate triphosphohydrolase [Methylopila sp. Yamaguchi]|nr:deoxyguanosinetriphosphate triphosphohydrolase [Methylopila sp. Yamaguchi]
MKEQGMDVPAIDVTAWILRPRASYAADPTRGRGRLTHEPASPTRTDFQRDRDRVLHSTSFRRLKHKTQVFVYHEGDHFRTRLTHTLEVAQIARSIARALGLDEDLAETIALSHDIGHPPFGHAGEKALDACMAGHGGFDHNAQSLRALTKLEKRYADYDGLNLTFESLEGVVKHNGPLLDGEGRTVGAYAGRPLPAALVEYAAVHDLGLDTHATAEAQAAAIADDIAYDAHDIDDGLRAGLITLDDLSGSRLLAGIMAEVRDRHPGLDHARMVHEIVRRVITRLVEDAIGEGARRLAPFVGRDVDAVRAAGRPLIAFSPAMAEAERELKRLMFAKLYRHPYLNRVMADARQVVSDLYGAYAADPKALPPEWARAEASDAPGRRPRLVADFIAGMTDRYALSEHARLFDATPELR